MEEKFDKDKLYQLYFRGSSVKLFILGLQKYRQYLEEFKRDGTEQITQKLTGLNRLISWIREELKNFSSDWDMNVITLHGETLSLLKSTLPYLLTDAESEKKEISKKNPPPEAFEGVDRKIETIKALTDTGLMASIPTDNIMGKIDPTEQTDGTGVVIIDGELQETVRKISDDATNNDRAIDDSITILEDRLRKISGLTNNDYGQRLIDKALRPSDGILIISDIGNEQEGYWKLYDGFLKALKNPTSHRRIQNITRNETIQIIQFADYLIGLLQKVRQRKPV